MLPIAPALPQPRLRPLEAAPAQSRPPGGSMGEMAETIRRTEAELCAGLRKPFLPTMNGEPLC